MSILDTEFMFLNKGDNWHLAYSADIRCEPYTFNTGEYITSLIQVFIEGYISQYTQDQEEIEEIAEALGGIVTSDDDIVITEFQYGYDEDWSAATSMMSALIVYTENKIAEVLEISSNNETYQSFWNNMLWNMLLSVINSPETIINEIPEFSNNTNNITKLHDFRACYVSNISKFYSKYGEDAGFFSEDPVLFSYTNYGYFTFGSSYSSSNLYKVVIEYGDKSYEYYTDEINNNVYGDSINFTNVDAQTMFNLYNAANTDNKYFHFKIYADHSVSYPLPVVPLTISSTSVTTSYDGLPHHGTAGISEGSLLTGDSITITPINYTNAGTYSSGFVYQITYQQPQRCVYDVTRDCGTITIN